MHIPCSLQYKKTSHPENGTLNQSLIVCVGPLQCVLNGGVGRGLDFAFCHVDVVHSCMAAAGLWGGCVLHAEKPGNLFVNVHSLTRGRQITRPSLSLTLRG